MDADFPPPRSKLPSFDDVLAAANRLEGIAHRTPVLRSRSFDAKVGSQCFFKCENFQRVGAFKFRGAYNAMAKLSESQASAGVVTHSSGNHAQAVALAGKLLGVARTIVMPSDSPKVKLAAVQSYGANIVRYDPKGSETREAISLRLASEQGLTLISPFDHEDVIAGQGTTALELIQDAPKLDALVVCLGGGGLLSGCAIAARHLNPSIKIIGVEPELANDAQLSLRRGERLELPLSDTIADGARTNLCDRTFGAIRTFVDDVVTVSDADLLATMHFVWERMKLVVEPTGVLATAALFTGKLSFPDKKVGVIVSGGNVDLAMAGAWFGGVTR